MGRRDLSIILIFIMLALGGGLPQALHWKVDHGCCGSGCTIAQELMTAPVACCPHHSHNDQSKHDEREHADRTVADASIDSSEMAVGADPADAVDPAAIDETPMGDEHDCPVCQFLATLTAIVAPALITPVHVDAVEWIAADRGRSFICIDRNSSQGPRAPPHVI